jgi:hypothetical protein
VVQDAGLEKSLWAFARAAAERYLVLATAKVVQHGQIDICGFEF